MKKGECREGIVERVDYPGKGRVVLPEGAAAVKLVLPGQKIRFQITKARRSALEGRLLEVLEQSPQWQEPDCPHFGSCGGCTYRELSAEDQLELKKDQIVRLLSGACDDPHFEGIYESPSLPDYRNKMEFSFGDEYKDGPLALGMHKRGSFYDIVTVDKCRIVDGDFRRILQAVLNLAQESGLPYHHRNTHEGYFRHLLIRKSFYQKQILADLVTTTQLDPEKEALLDEKLVQTLLSLEGLEGTITGILHTHNDRVADVIENEGTTILYGSDRITEQLLGMSFQITPFSFFQTNSRGAEVLYRIVRDYAGETRDKVIFDLYSGTGTIAQILAPVARHVTGIEIVEEAVAAARENAEQNRLTNCTFIAGDVLKEIASLTEKPDIIILDPPREGVNPKALQKIIDFGVEKMVYISCKATSLVRDLELLQQCGYRVERSCAVNLFPGTVHCEVVTLITRA